MAELQGDLLKFSEEEQACCLEVVELHGDDSLQMLNFALISLVVEVQCHASQRIGYSFDRINLDRSNHAYTWVRFVVPEFEREISGLDMNSRGSDEYRLEANTFCTNVSVGS